VVASRQAESGLNAAVLLRVGHSSTDVCCLLACHPLSSLALTLPYLILLFSPTLGQACREERKKDGDTRIASVEKQGGLRYYHDASFRCLLLSVIIMPCTCCLCLYACTLCLYTCQTLVCYCASCLTWRHWTAGDSGVSGRYSLRRHCGYLLFSALPVRRVQALVGGYMPHALLKFGGCTISLTWLTRRVACNCGDGIVSDARKRWRTGDDI